MTQSESSSFELLDKRIQHYIWAEKWGSLRDAQERAIPIILKGNINTIIAAATASGKTEAAFLPALSYLLATDLKGLIIYVSPLKALINDQFRRLDLLCDALGIPVWPWHGDVSASVKSRFMKDPRGVLLITPESLEATLFNRGSSLRTIFSRLIFVVIDELHAFISSERGKQLQSLLRRIDCIRNSRVTRVGLSATIGDMSLAASFMCPGCGDSVHLIESKSDSKDLLIKLRGFEEPAHVTTNHFTGRDDSVNPEINNDQSDPGDEGTEITPGYISLNLYSAMRGSNNLIFPNSKSKVELYTHNLRKLCAENSVPNEFWPHHGNLSKELRSETEEALRQVERPVTVICTSTLELGIDVGAVKSVAQIDPPPSVASLKQRLGRSGRRANEPEILRGYVREREYGSSNPSLADDLRLATIEFIACISLLIQKWFEPPVSTGFHFSTLIQQILSLIGQNGGMHAGALFNLLCSGNAPFSSIEKGDFIDLLTWLGRKELIMQDSSGLLLHGRVGEKIVNHYSFYAAFATPEEFRIVFRGKTLGTLPILFMLNAGQRLLFAGRTWLVEDVDEEKKVIFVQRSRGGTPPLFSGEGSRVHTKVRQRMYELLSSTDMPIYLDSVATKFLNQARSFFIKKDLQGAMYIDQGSQVTLLTWLGDNSNEALCCLLASQGIVATASGPTIEIPKKGLSTKKIVSALTQASLSEVPSVDVLLSKASNLQRAKWDWALPPSLLRKSYASLYLNLPEALEWASCLEISKGIGRESG
jgi:ATP-dependent Lhr-like helicase